MKELKFRIWNNGHNEFIRPDYGLIGFCYPLDGRIAVLTANSDPVEDCVIEQYTGLKDKNGDKEIYEGDIVSEEFEYGGEKTKTIWQVRWCDDECAFELHYVSGFEVDDCSLVSDDEENYEIIGNVHENADLLKELK